MNELRPAAAIALLCDERSTIEKLISDDLGLANKAVPGRLLLSLVDSDSVGKALNFLSTLRTDGVAIGWELNVSINERIRPLQFAGTVDQGKFIIVAGETKGSISQVLEDMVRINNEQTNLLRSALKEQNLETRNQNVSYGESYNELTHLNNELTNLQRDLAKKNAELEQIKEQRNRLLGVVAHDLRTPLNMLQLYSSLLLQASAELSSKDLSLVSTMHDSSQFMLRMVNELLDISKIGIGELTLELAPINLIELIQKNILLNTVIAEDKGIKVIYESCQHLPPMTIDLHKIDQVINKLMLNAIKYSTENSAVKVVVSRDENNAVIEVADQGPGIPEKEQYKLLKLFSKKSGRNPKIESKNELKSEQSRGLGLAIVEKIVTGHKGKIWLTSNLGKGTSFFVSLPIR